jgi:hypothetical protein
MLLAVELVTSLLLGFALGRIWEIRRRVVLMKGVDERPPPVGSRVQVQVSKRQPKDEEELVAAFDREMKELVRVGAAKERRLAQIAAGASGPVHTKTAANNTGGTPPTHGAREPTAHPRS